MHSFWGENARVFDYCSPQECFLHCLHAISNPMLNVTGYESVIIGNCCFLVFVDRHAQLETNILLQQKEMQATVCISIFYHDLILSVLTLFSTEF